MELLERLNKSFIERYSKQFAELNKNVYISVKTEDGMYEAPTVSIGAGGGTLVSSLKEGEKITNPAPVTVEMSKKKPINIVYRLAIPRSEVEIADKNPAYFKYLFDKILEKALGNYKATIGGPEILRFGSYYITASLLNINDGSDFIELRIEGDWASDEAV